MGGAAWFVWVDRVSVELGPHDRFAEQRVELLQARRWSHTQGLCTSSPTCVVRLQQLRFTRANQHGFKHTVGQLQAAVA